MFIAAECFRDTLIGIGVLEMPAEAARRAFLALQKNNLEQTQNKLLRIASKVSCMSVANSLHQKRQDESKEEIKAADVGKPESKSSAKVSDSESSKSKSESAEPFSIKDQEEKKDEDQPKMIDTKG